MKSAAMSQVYDLEPPTKGKVLLHTTHGDIEVELWPKEAPKVCCLMTATGASSGTWGSFVRHLAAHTAKMPQPSDRCWTACHGQNARARSRKSLQVHKHATHAQDQQRQPACRQCATSRSSAWRATMMTPFSTASLQVCMSEPHAV